MRPRSWVITAKLSGCNEEKNSFVQKQFQQESIPVGCVTSAAVAAGEEGGCIPAWTAGFPLFRTDEIP